MIISFLISYLRFVLKNKIPSLLSVIGLGLGIACTLSLSYFIHYEAAFDSFNKNNAHIYRIVYGDSDDRGSVYTSHILGTTLQESYPGVKAVRFNNAGNARSLFTYQDNKYMESRFYFTDANVFDVFSFPLKRGDGHCLDKPFTMVITEQAAVKYFGNADPIGKSISMEWGGKNYDLAVTGVLSEVPSASHLQFDYLISMATAERIFQPETFFTDWTADFGYTYLFIQNEGTRQAIDEMMTGMVDKNTGRPTTPDTHLRLQPIERIHLYSRLAGDPTPGTDIKYLYLAASVGVLILIMSLINYANISSALYTKRLREIGVRKIFGARAGSISAQFAFESFVNVVIALLFSSVLLIAGAKFLEELLGSRYRLVDLIASPTIWAIIVILILVTAALTWFQSRTVNRGAAEILYGRFKTVMQKVSFRNVLVGVQIGATFIIIVVAIVVDSQMTYISKADLGYESSFMISLPEGRTIRERSEAIKQGLMSTQAVSSITLSSSIPSRSLGFKVPTIVEGGNPDGSTEPWQLALVSVDYDFFDVFDLKVVEGRMFSNEFVSDSTQGIILNETAVKELHWESPLGRELQMTYNVGDGTSETRKGRVIGVIKDFHYESFHKSIVPMAFVCKPFWYYYVTLKLKGKDMQREIGSLKDKWEEVVPGVPFEYSFQEQRLANLYVTERSWGKGVSVFSAIAVCISCLGLFGLVVFMTQSRMREVAIRKIHGADSFTILLRMYLSVAVIIAAAVIAAAPVVWYVSGKWLDGFAYRIPMSGWIYLSALGWIVLVSTLVVLGQMVRASRSNPIDVLKID